MTLITQPCALKMSLYKNITDTRVNWLKEMSKNIDQIKVWGELKLNGLSDGPKEIVLGKGKKLHDKRESIKEREGVKKLYSMLKKEDPIYANRIQSNDEQRIIRALEVIEISESSFSSLIESNPKKNIQAMLTYPKNIGRNFNEIVRELEALQVSSELNVSTPANWEFGDDVIVSNDIPDEDIKEKYEVDEYNVFETFLRTIKQPGHYDGNDARRNRVRN